MTLRQRLDQHLVARGLVVSRARARDLIKRGEVSVDGVVVTKAGRLLDDTCEFLVSDDANRFVARSAEKLNAALVHFALPVKDRVALDIGASTGGFTQVLIERGARQVYAVDVGHGQLHPKISGDPRVRDMSGVDARDLRASDFSLPITAIAADVSFISVTKALPQALTLASRDCWIVVLVKPQFELNPGAVGKGGIVRDEARFVEAVTTVENFLTTAGWRVDGFMPSPLLGKRGNREFLVCAYFLGS